MLITTTPNIEGKRIKEYLGIVTGEAVVGANLFRDLFAGLRDIVGGRSGAYEKELRKARDLAFEEITEAALELGANAILGVDIDEMRHLLCDKYHICDFQPFQDDEKNTEVEGSPYETEI
jgi:uncharacterized protein YbjQ (UPF0145 family)